MSSKPEAKIGLGMSDAPAVKALKAFGDNWNSTFSALNQGTELLSKGLSALAVPFQAVLGFMGKSIEAANVQERADTKLATALRIRGDLSKETLGDLKAYASELQGLTRTGDEVTEGIMAQLLTMGVQRAELKEATKATLGLAEQTGSLDTAAKLVARTLAGETTALKRYGIQAADTQDAMSQLLAMFRLAEEDANTFSGRVQQLENAWGDLLETFGFAITKSETVNALLVEGRKIIEAINTEISESGFGAWIDDVARKMVTFLDPTLAGFAELITEVQRLAPALTAVGDAIEFVREPWFPYGPNNPAWRDLVYGPTQPEDTAPGRIATAINQAREALRQFDDELGRSRLAGQFKQTRFVPEGTLTKPSGGKKKKQKTGGRAVDEYVPASARGGVSVGEFDAEAAFASDDQIFNAERQAIEGMAKAMDASADSFRRSGELVTATLASTRVEVADTFSAMIGFTQGFFGTVLSDSMEGLAEWGKQITDWGTNLANVMQTALAGVGQAVAGSIRSAMEGGTAEFDKALGRILVGLGEMLIATGVTSMVLGLLSYIPGLQLVTGAPGQAILSGFAATAVGVGLLGAGTALGGSRKANIPRAPGSGFSGRYGGYASNQTPSNFGVGDGLDARGPTTASTTTVYANFGPASGANPRRNARELRRLLGDR